MNIAKISLRLSIFLDTALLKSSLIPLCNWNRIAKEIFLPGQKMYSSSIISRAYKHLHAIADDKINFLSGC